MQIVPAVRTGMSAQQARDALLAALPGLDRETAALLLALVWVETGAGGLMNFNAGNISASERFDGTAWRPPWFSLADVEALPDSPKKNVLRETHFRMLGGQAPSAFRAYRSAAEGFGDFARQLASSFRSVLDAGASGSPAAFVQALHDSGYSRDYNSSHIPTFTKLQQQFAPLVAHLPTGGSAAGVGLLLAALAGLYALNRSRRRPPRRRHAHPR